MTGPVELVLSRLEGVHHSRPGWRAQCPACGGRSQKLAVAESSSGSVLIHCFAGCSAAEVVRALGLRVCDLYPQNERQHTPESRRANRRAVQEAGWRAALSVLAVETRLVHFTACTLARGEPLLPADEVRLGLALARIEDAKAVLCDR